MQHVVRFPRVGVPPSAQRLIADGWALGVLLSLSAVLGLLVWAAWPVPVVRLYDASAGHTIAVLPLESGATLRMTYLHSIYQQTASEEFVVTREGFRLARISSPSVAVLEYYARPEPILPTPDGAMIIVAETPTPSVAMLASPTGKRAVEFLDHRYPLHEVAANGARIRLSVADMPRFRLWGS